MPAKMKLPVGYTVIDVQSTPDGYYHITFRKTDGTTVDVTQHGRGGANLYQPWQEKEDLMQWLDDFRPYAIKEMEALHFPDLAQTVRDQDNEWEDVVVMSIVDHIEMGYVSVEG